MKMQWNLILSTRTVLFFVFTAAFLGAFLNSPVEAVCVKNPFTGKKICHQDLDPTVGIPGSAEVAEKLWGTAGRAAYPSAAEAMRTKNAGRPAKSLSSAHKRLLKARYGGIVDNVQVVYNATTLEKWCALGECVRVSKPESAAQTYGNTVYVVDSERPSDINQFLLLSHELKHVQQQKGRLDIFGYDYFKAYKQAGLTYENNRMEQEARAEEEWFAQRVVCPSTGCQWR